MINIARKEAHKRHNIEVFLEYWKAIIDKHGVYPVIPVDSSSPALTY